MKKQELIHLHGLLAEISKHCREVCDEPVDLDDYTALGIRPTSIHKSKTDHKAAVFALTGGITNRLAPAAAETETETVPASAD